MMDNPTSSNRERNKIGDKYLPQSQDSTTANTLNRSADKPGKFSKPLSGGMTSTYIKVKLLATAAKIDPTAKNNEDARINCEV
jgi:hypothetical protein